MDLAQAQRVIESLRKGIPPDGFVRDFTVGRASEVTQLTERLDDVVPGALLLKANYGSGKTHLLRFIHECALDKGYAVSTVTLDCKGAVRFNRMDQILGAICRSIEVPHVRNERGIRAFMNHIEAWLEGMGPSSADGFVGQLTNGGKWDYSNALDSQAFYIALRAWVKGSYASQDRVEDWLSNPWMYRTQRKLLYTQLIHVHQASFREPRSERQFYINEVFGFDQSGYAQCWSTLRDIYKMAVASGLKGFIILFDEFEDVITNLNNIGHQEDAFWNLFQFYSGEVFPGLTCYAVTPEFATKCKELLLRKGRWDFDYTRFEAIPTFQMTPLDVEELEKLAMRILETHGIAYDWEPELVMRAAELDKIVRKAASVPIQDRARHTIITVVKVLDHLLEENE